MLFKKYLLSREYLLQDSKLHCKKCNFNISLSDFIIDVISSINTRQSLCNSKIWAIRNYLKFDRLDFDKCVLLKDGRLEFYDNTEFKPKIFVVNIILYDEQGRITC